MTTARAPARTFQDLVVWQKAHEFVLAVYRYSAGFPKTETYGLAAQFRRAAVSIPANIAEGFRKRGRPDKVRFLNIAQGSIEECRYYLILAQDLEYGEGDSLMPLLEEVSRILDAYAKAILTPDS
jgi:four helix bundle protein